MPLSVHVERAENDKLQVNARNDIPHCTHAHFKHLQIEKSPAMSFSGSLY